MKRSWINNATPKDQSNGYLICPLCKKNVLVLNAGADVKRTTQCDRCGESHLATVGDYFKTGNSE